MTGELFVLGLLAQLTIVVSVVLWNVFATARAKIAAGGHGAYESLAERAIDAEERTAASLADLVRRLDESGPAAPSGRSD